jgi:pimeloyl-ACP methyl ester carboxylesterase
LIEAVWNGRIVSEATISSRISAARNAIGDTGEAQLAIRTIRSRGFRFVAEVVVSDHADPDAAASSTASSQKVRFCQSSDGTRIAYATFGAGPALVRAGHWLTHLEHDWHSPVWRPLLDELGNTFRVTRHDQRGNGLSDWSIRDTALDRFVEDLEAVVDAAGLDRFVLYGTSQGAPIGIAYAVRHPDRVSHLVLHGGYVKGRSLRSSVAEREQGEALLALIRHGWGREGSPFIKAFTSMYIPDGTTEQTDSVVDLQRRTTSPENAVVLRAAVDRFDVTELLEKVAAPTLVIHAANDGVHPLDEGRALAAGIRDAEFVLLESANHVILPQEPAWTRLFDAIRGFVLG